MGRICVKVKKGLRIFLIVLIAAIVIGAAVVFLPSIIGLFKKDAPEDASRQLEELADEYKEVSYDEKKGYAYVNNRIVLIADYDASEWEIESLLDRYDATIAYADPALGIYYVALEGSHTLKELKNLAETLKESYLVEDAYVDPVMLMEDDAVEIDEDVTPVYPTDDWDGASWDVDVPRDENWGMEAVRAPKAWAFLDELETVRVGLIDSLVNRDHPDLDVKHAYYTQYDREKNVITTMEVPDYFDPDSKGHGTHVAGIMAATWNDEGVSGLLGNKAELYYSCAREKNDSGYYTAMTYYLAIKNLVDQDVRAINISQNSGWELCFAASRGNKNAIAYLEDQAKTAGALLKRLIRTRQSNGSPDFVICISAGNVNNIEFYKKDDAPYGYSLNSSTLFERSYSGDALAYYNNFLATIEDEEVKNRIIVVGSVGIDAGHSSKKETCYSYADSSNVGDRVDICAPGKNIYSCVNSGYGIKSGTSMATPHVTAAAAMLFAANPDLTGPQVKQILKASTYGRYYYTGGNSGLLDVNAAVQRALATREQNVHHVIPNSGSDALDLCFIVDTTGSMGDDIDNAKENMRSILAKLSEKSSNYRVAFVDYRDFYERTYDSDDYPAKVQLPFSDDDDVIYNAIYALDLGYGGDSNETVYSGIMTALGLDWRPNATRVIILMGDAQPLDPEPYTGYTYDSIVKALYYADVSIDAENSDRRVLGDAEDSEISVYSLFTSDSYSGYDSFFDSIATDTGGMLTNVENADEVADAISDSIDMIEVGTAQTVRLEFGEENSEETAEIYSEAGEYLFSIPLDEKGRFRLDGVEPGKYRWKIERLGAGGSFTVKADREAVTPKKSDAWYSFALRIWHRHKVLLFVCAGGLIVLTVGILLLVKAIKKRKKNGPKPPKPEKTAKKPQVNRASGAAPQPVRPRQPANDTRYAAPQPVRPQQPANGTRYAAPQPVRPQQPEAPHRDVFRNAQKPAPARNTWVSEPPTEKREETPNVFVDMPTPAPARNTWVSEPATEKREETPNVFVDMPTPAPVENTWVSEPPTEKREETPNVFVDMPTPAPVENTWASEPPTEKREETPNVFVDMPTPAPVENTWAKGQVEARLPAQEWICPNCHGKNEASLTVCDYCGTEAPKPTFCKKCGRRLEESERFCLKCGTPQKE